MGSHTLGAGDRIYCNSNVTMHSEDPRDDPDAWDHVRTYDAGSERPSEAVLHAVSEATGRDVMVGEPLYTAVDPDALDSLARTDGDYDVAVSFSYLGCVVYADGEAIRVRQLDECTPE